MYNIASFSHFYRYTETFTHMIKGNIGCGMLAMGMAYKNGGILFTTILVLVIGAISCYNQYILVRKKLINENNIFFVYVY